jgi:hypothetical protein
VILLALRQQWKMPYRAFCDMIEVCTLLLDELGLGRVPHWTTLHKFSKRTDTRRLERLLLGFLDEARKQLIVAVKFRRGPANDSPDFVNVLKKVQPAELPVKLVVADKGYDAESNHEYAQDVLGARTAIPVRAASRPKIKMSGKRRRKQARDFDKKGYDGHRPKVETVFSVEKRKMGSHVLARNPSQQHKELVFRAFSYNSGRIESLFLFFIEVFYKATRK